MDNYKIKVKDEAENVDIQNAFFALGYGWSTDRKKEVVTSQDMINEGYSSNYKITFIYAGEDGCLLCGDDCDDEYRSYARDEAKGITLPELLKLVPKSKPQDPALISGADAMIAAIDGKDVEYEWIEGSGNWRSFNDEEWSAEDLKSGAYRFRLKPTTLTVNAELPKPQKETQHNSLVYAVTYEFKSREERNAFADKLRGTNS